MASTSFRSCSVFGLEMMGSGVLGRKSFGSNILGGSDVIRGCFRFFGFADAGLPGFPPLSEDVEQRRLLPCSPEIETRQLKISLSIES